MIEIRPTTNISATVGCPPSKSYTNRALLIAALADGECRIEFPLFSDDTRYMKEALIQFGIPVRQEENAFVIAGKAGVLSVSERELFVGNAGTTMRFLTTFSALAPGLTYLTGDDRMQERPISDLLDCLNLMGIRAESVRKNSCPPLEIHGGQVQGGSLNLAGDKSSQYLTSVLLSAPYFRNDTTIKIQGELTSKSYADITLDIMKSFGVHVENEGYRKFVVPSGKKYQARNYRVEGDWSSASYFLAAAAVAGGTIDITALNPDSVQGDAGFLNVLKQMGCSVEKTGEKIHLRANPLKGISINMNSMPDAVQTLAVVALFADGPTRIDGIGNLRIKETDRIRALATELFRLGAEVESGDDFLIVKPGTYAPAEIETYHDHRMAMSFAVAGLKIPGVKIKNPGCVAKSFPDFFERFNKIYE
ncbi:MAG: 3-phosphoshikimate 1-carboxyvinyltransferase [Nitrospinota bacterium]|nr:3-phosphoshikimate 1-carboxyvinyltransferase [Nitrospinota bacterium]